MQVANAWEASELKFLTICSLNTSSFPQEMNSVSLHKSISSLDEKDSAACYKNAQSVMSTMPLPMTNRAMRKT